MTESRAEPERMNPRRTRTLRNFRRRGPLIAVAAAAVMLLGIGVPAYAQFFPFGGPPRPPRPVQQAPQPYGGFGGGTFPFFNGYEQPRPPPQIDYSHAPRPEKTDNVPERFVLVLGDSMADWLAYGLEDAFREQPDMGVTRKHKTVSGLIKYQPKGEPSDWIAAAKQIVPAEKADVIVVMLGLNDRVAIRDTGPDPKTEPKAGDKKKADAAKSELQSLTPPSLMLQSRRRQDRYEIRRCQARRRRQTRRRPAGRRRRRRRQARDHRAGKKHARAERALRIPRRALGRALQ